MDRPLKEHIAYLERRVEELSKKLMESAQTLAERNRIDSEIRAATLALRHFHAALEAEQNLSPEHPTKK